MVHSALTLSTLTKLCGLVGAQYKENMMYSDKLVVAIKSNGKILREAKDLVQLPFGSEFSVLVKNLNSRRAKFTLHIDGQDVLDGENIIVNANDEVEMKRFIRNGNMTEGNAFKFIERTAAIEDGPRGIKMDDGVVRVQFWFEQEAPVITSTYHYDYWYDDFYYPRRRYYKSFWDNTLIGGRIYNATSTDSSLSKGIKTKGGPLRSAKMQAVAPQAMNSVFSAQVSSTDAVSYNSATTFDSIESTPTADVTVTNDVGITVPGSKVEQKFHTVYGFNAEAQSHVIVIRLTGRVGAINIVAPVTVKTKQKCSTCNHTNKANAKFCSECGTSLELM